MYNSIQAQVWYKKGYLDATKPPWPYKELWVVSEQAFWSQTHWWQGGRGGIYATLLLFIYDFDGCEFSEVRKEISLYLSVTVCRAVLKLNLALVTGSVAISMERGTADAIADADDVLLWKTKKAHCHVRRSPSLIAVPIHMYPVHTLLPYFFWDPF